MSEDISGTEAFEMVLEKLLEERMERTKERQRICEIESANKQFAEEVSTHLSAMVARDNLITILREACSALRTGQPLSPDCRKAIDG